VTDKKAAAAHGVAIGTDVPELVYYEKEIPSVYDGDYDDAEAVLEWLTDRVEGADIEGVTGEMLERMVVKEERIAVLFYKGPFTLQYVFHVSIDLGAGVIHVFFGTDW
jgi:hypothetical protein